MSLDQNDEEIIGSVETKMKGHLSHAHCIDILSSYTLLGISISFFRVYFIEIFFTRTLFYRIKHYYLPLF